MDLLVLVSVVQFRDGEDIVTVALLLVVSSSDLSFIHSPSLLR